MDVVQFVAVCYSYHMLPLITVMYIVISQNMVKFHVIHKFAAG